MLLSVALWVAAIFGCTADARQARMSNAEKSVVLTDSDNGKTVSLAKGAVLVLKLTSQPGTGYSWRLAGGESGPLRLVGKPETEPASDGAIGQTQHEIFRFEVESSGTSTLEVEYSRGWEKGAALKTFRLEVHVR